MLKRWFFLSLFGELRVAAGNRISQFDFQVKKWALLFKQKASRLSFASPDRLKTYLGIDPGSVSLLALLNDSEKKVEVFIDNELWDAETILCHPLVNTSTLAVPRDGIKQFLEKTGHTLRLVEVPVK